MISIALGIVAATWLPQTGQGPFRSPLPTTVMAVQNPKAAVTGKYRSPFREIGKTDEQIAVKLNQAWDQLFYGKDSDQRVYYPVGSDMAYIKDVGNNDVRSEGMSYGLMLAVQFDRKPEFDRLWKWSKTYMQHASGPWKGYFAWQLDPDGKKRTNVPASDGEEYFVMALFFAANRWGNGKGIFHYQTEANEILRQMIHKRKLNGGVVDGATNIFDSKERQVVFVPTGDAATFSDPSYHLPAFYELWAKWADHDRSFWRDAATVSRQYFRKACHPKTGLASDYATFDGKPKKAPWDPNNRSDHFLFDAFRVAGNIAMDHHWFGKDPWQIEQSNRLLDFFAAQKPDYVSNYSVEGKPLVNFKSVGLIAMNASATLAATSPNRTRFIKELWDAPIPSGQWRYYDGMLYMFGLLHCSGQYRVYAPKVER
jgi:oligosaccharide reducing-end xylanase